MYPGMAASPIMAGSNDNLPSHVANMLFSQVALERKGAYSVAIEGGSNSARF
jgi:hypothetical protein